MDVSWIIYISRVVKKQVMYNNKKIIFGAGSLGRNMKKTLFNTGISVDYFCDNNPKLWNTEIDGILVLSPQQILNIKNKYIVIRTKYISEIKRQLLDMGVEPGELVGVEDIYALHNVEYPSPLLENVKEKYTSLRKKRCDLSIVILSRTGEVSQELVSRIEETVIGVDYEIVVPEGERLSINGAKVIFMSGLAYMQKGWLDNLLKIYNQYDGKCIVGSQIINYDRLVVSAGRCFLEEKLIDCFSGTKYLSSESSYVREVDGLLLEGLMVNCKNAKSLWETILQNETDRFFYEKKEEGIPIIYQPDSVFLLDSSEITANMIENVDNIFERESNRNMILFHYGIPTPDKAATGRTIDQYINIFSKQKMNILLVAQDYFYDEKYAKLYQQKGIMVVYGETWRENREERLKPYIENSDYIFFVSPSYSRDYLDLVKKYNPTVVTSYYGVDIKYSRLERQYDLTGEKKYLEEAEKTRIIEESLIREMDYSGYPSHLEVDILKKQFPDKNIQYYPAFYYQDREIIKKENTCKGMIFVGAFGHAPNSDGVLWFAQHVMPILRDNGFIEPVYIVGSNPPQEILALANEQFIIKGYVTDDELTSLYKDCRMAFAPLRFGAGIKGKILEAMYNGLPMVTTHIGAESIDIEESGLIIADTAEEYAKAILDNYFDNDVLARRSEMGQRYTMKYFGEEQLEKLFSTQIWGKEFSEK